MINKIWKYTFAFASICLLILLVFQASSEIHRVEKIITFQDSLTTLNLKIQGLKNTIENERINYDRLLMSFPDSIQPNENGFMLQSLQKD
jgi:hypothetical protein